MSDVKDLFRPLDSTEPPDQWDQISRADPVPARLPPRRPSRFVAALAAAVVVTAGLVALLVSAFTSSSMGPNPATPPPSRSSPVVTEIALGDSVRLSIAPNGGLSSMVEAFGSVWVIGQFQAPASGTEQLRRLDPSDGTIQAEFRLPIAGGGEWGGNGLVMGGGYLWATAWNSATIFRIDPTEDSVTRFSFHGRIISDLALDQTSGELWAVIATDGANNNSVLVQLDPGDGTVVSSTPYTSEWTSGLMVAQGSVWVLERHMKNATVSDGHLRQLMPGTAPDVMTGGSFALPVTDGRWIWAPASGDDRVMNLASGIAQIDPSDGSVDGLWNVGDVGYDVAVGPDGGIWFLGPDGLHRLNPSSGAIQSWEAATDGETATFVVPTSGGVWVGTHEGSLYFRSLTGLGDVQP